MAGHYDFENEGVCIEFSNGILYFSILGKYKGIWDSDILTKEGTKKLYLAMKEYFEGEDGKDVQG